MVEFICGKCNTIFDKTQDMNCPKCGESREITMLRLYRLKHPESKEGEGS